MVQFCYPDENLQKCVVKQAAFMRLFLRKVATMLRERTTARTKQAALRLPDD